MDEHDGQLLAHEGGHIVLNVRRQRGFSLIELMVTLTILGIVLAVAVPEFKIGMLNRQIRGTADAIQSGLMLAKTEALRRNRPVKFELGAAVGSWLVGCEPADATIVDGQESCPATIQSRSGDTNSSLAIDVVDMDLAGGGAGAAPSTQVKVNPMGRTTPDTVPAGKMRVYQVSNPAGGTCELAGGKMRCLNVLMTAMGQIRMCDPKAVAPDPRACPW